MPRNVPFYVSMPLVGRKSAAQWAHVSRRLQTCLQSYLRSTDPDFEVVISGHEIPDIPEVNDSRVRFLEMSFPSDRYPPERYFEDKAAKRRNNLKWITERGGGDVFVADADDHVHHTLIERIRKMNHPFGHVIEKGLGFGLATGSAAPIPGVFSSPFHRVCGTSSIIRTMGEAPNSAIWKLPLGNHSRIAETSAALGRPLNVIDGDSVAYVISSAHSAALLNRRTEASVRKLQRKIRRRRLTMTPDLIEGYHLVPLLEDCPMPEPWWRRLFRR